MLFFCGITYFEVTPGGAQFAFFLEITTGGVPVCVCVCVFFLVWRLGGPDVFFFFFLFLKTRLGGRGVLFFFEIAPWGVQLFSSKNTNK